MAAVAVLAVLAVLAVPTVATASVVAKGFGPFDTPFEPAAASAFARDLGGIAEQTRPLLPALERPAQGQPDLMATQTSAVAAPFIYDSGKEVLPIGGFTGTIPSPTLARLQAMIARGDFHLVIQAPKVGRPPARLGHPALRQPRDRASHVRRSGVLVVLLRQSRVAAPNRARPTSHASHCGAGRSSGRGNATGPASRSDITEKPTPVPSTGTWGRPS